MAWLVIIIILAAIIGIGALVSSLRKQKDLTLSEVATCIEEFATGTGLAYDWDDFTTCPHIDPHVTSIVKECEQVAINFPARHQHEWCNPEGSEELKKIAERVRKEAQQSL